MYWDVLQYVVDNILHIGLSNNHANILYSCFSSEVLQSSYCRIGYDDNCNKLNSETWIHHNNNNTIS